MDLASGLPVAPASSGVQGRLLVHCPVVFRGWTGRDNLVRPVLPFIACSPGWDAPIEVLFEALEEGALERIRRGLLITRHAPAPLQIKERHGLLRVDLYHAAEWSLHLVELAMQQSARMCVDCGAEVHRALDARLVEVARCPRHSCCSEHGDRDSVGRGCPQAPGSLPARWLGLRQATEFRSRE
jgi:hypothetical protein